MSMVAVAPSAHKIGAPVMLEPAQLQARRAQIEHEHGKRDELTRKRDLIGLTLQERIALQDLEDLDFLEGR